MATDFKSEIGNYKLTDDQKLTIQIVIVILGTIIRLFVYATNYPKPSDILGYMHDARFLMGKEDEYEYQKEIGYPLFLSIIGQILGVSYRVARLSSIFLGIVNIYISAIMARSVMKRWGYSEDFSYNASLFVSFLVSISSIITKSDNIGVREAVYTLLFLILITLLYKDEFKIKHRVGIFVISFLLGLIKTEFQYIGFGFAFLLAVEGIQYGYRDFKAKSISLAIGAISAFIFWNLVSTWLFSSTTTNYYIDGFVNNRNPNQHAEGGWGWFIFEYLGFSTFIFYIFSGVYRLIKILPIWLGLITFSFGIIGGKEVIKSSRLTILLLYLGVAFFNGLVAYEVDLVGLDRIMSVYFPLLFIYPAIGVMKSKAIIVKMTPKRNYQIPNYGTLFLILLIIIIESMVIYLV